MDKDRVREHFEAIAGDYDRWKTKASYYYELLAQIYAEIVPPGSSVLEVGCGTGTLLATLRPRRGVGVDISPTMVDIASSKFPHLSFRVADAEALELAETFDFVIVPDVVEHLADAGAMLRSVRGCLRPDSRLIVTTVNPLWATILSVAERLGLKMPEGQHRWLSAKRLIEAAEAAGYRTIASYGRILCPKRIPILAAGANRAAGRAGFLSPLCLTQVLILASG